MCSGCTGGCGAHCRFVRVGLWRGGVVFRSLRSVGRSRLTAWVCEISHSCSLFLMPGLWTGCVMGMGCPNVAGPPDGPGGVNVHECRKGCSRDELCGFYHTLGKPSHPEQCSHDATPWWSWWWHSQLHTCRSCRGFWSTSQIFSASLVSAGLSLQVGGGCKTGWVSCWIFVEFLCLANVNWDVLPLRPPPTINNHFLGLLCIYGKMISLSSAQWLSCRPQT